MTLGERLVVDGKLLLAEDVRSEPREKAFPTRLNREADVFGYHMRETVRELVAPATRHSTVPQKRHEPVAVLDSLVRRPMRVDTASEHLHESVDVAGRMVVGLQDPRRRIGGEVVKTPRDEISRNDLVAIQNDEEIPLLGRVGQEVIQVTRLETRRTIRPADDTNAVLCRKGVDTPHELRLRTVIEDDDLVAVIALCHRPLEAQLVEVVAGAVHHDDMRRRCPLGSPQSDLGECDAPLQPEVIEQRVEHVLHAVQPEVADESHGRDDHSPHQRTGPKGILHQWQRAVKRTTKQQGPRGQDPPVEGGLLDLGKSPSFRH